MAKFEMDELSLKVGSFSLDGISLSLGAHEYFVLLGPVGSGKTVLLKAIAGYFRPQAGRIMLNGRDIASLPPRRRKVGYVPQHNDLFPNMDVSANIAFPMRAAGQPEKEVVGKTGGLLGKLGLSHIASRNVENLSGGERKKTAIARALAANPEILLLDEPLGMLDAPARSSVLDMLKDIHGESEIAVIHVSHERRDAWENAELCAIMNRGRIEQTGTPPEIFRSPATIFAAEFLGCANIFPAKFAESAGGTYAETAIGRLRLRRKPQNPGGHIVIRPELVELAKEKSPHGIGCRVISLADKGEFCEIRVAAGGGAEVVVHASLAAASSFCPGSEADQEIRPEAVHVI